MIGHSEIKITDEMIDAGVEVLIGYDPGFDTASFIVGEILRCALERQTKVSGASPAAEDDDRS